MKFCISLCTAVLLLFCTFSTLADSPDRSSAASQQRDGMQVVPNLIIIKLRPQTTFTTGGDRLGISGIDNILQRIGATRVELMNSSRQMGLQKTSAQQYNVDRMIKVRYTSADHPALLAHELENDASVEYAEPYYIFPFHYIPSDSRQGSQWALTVLKLREAWDITKGDSTIVIGDVDSGVDWTHEDLAENIWTNPGEWGTNGELSNNGVDDDGNGKIDDWHGWDFIGNGSSQSPNPDNDPMDGALGHGTNTSGCAAARTDNGIGIAGSGFSAKILAIKAAADNSSGIGAGYEGILYAGQMGAKVINCSWGSTGSFIRALQDVIDDVTDMGALVVGSSGNDPVDNDYLAHYPSSFNHVLNVGSVESSGAASNWCTYGNSVHVYSPGNGILTTRKSGGYTSPTGTSFSSPLAAGVAALVFAVHPDWTPDQVATQIRVTSDPFGTAPESKRYGRINAFKAVSVNANMDDIPGIRLKDFQVSFDGGGYRFTEPGQQAHVTMEIENVLAPTSSGAMAYVDLDDASIASAGTSEFSISGMSTFDTKTIEFDIALSETPATSEGSIPVRVRIEDGEYVDYVTGSVTIYLADAWHAVLAFGAPYFTGLDASTLTATWGNAHVSNQDIMVRSLNGGGSWAQANGSGYPSGKGVYCVEGRSGNVALVGTGPTTGAAEIYRTTNGGSNWTGVSVSSITGFVNWIHMFDDMNGIFQGDPKAGVWGIATTTDGGVSWTQIPNPPAAPSGEAGWNNSYGAAGDSLWFGTNNSKVYRSTDRGLTWEAIATPSKHSVDMAFADNLRGMVRFTTQENQGGSNMLAVTSDGGSTWNQIQTIEVNTGGSLEAERDGRRIWFIQGGNAWVTTDLGESWTVQAVPGGFSNITTSASFTNSAFTDVYAAGLNIFKYRSDFDPLNPTTGVDMPVTAEGFQIDYVYPNPLSVASAQGATVGFTLQQRSTVRVDIYDNLGRLAVEGAEAVLDAGSHSYRLPTGRLAAGSYLLRVQAGGHAAVSNLLLIH
ncbi:S8 family serine peptidase [bacterium]|nr:S8 family serine peptidase [bacterium]